MTVLEGIVLAAIVLLELIGGIILVAQQGQRVSDGGSNAPKANVRGRGAGTEVPGSPR